MGWLIGFGLVLGFATLFSALDANHRNVQMQQETNEQQERLFHEANEFNRQERLEAQEFNRQQVLEERAYNDPSMQAQRLLNAGLNPGAILGGDAAKTLGSATSSPASSSGIPSLTAPVTQGADFSGLMSPIMQAAQYEQMSTETQIRKEDLEFKGIDQMLNLSERIAKIDNTLADTSLKDSQRFKLEQERDNLGVIYDSLLLQYSRDFKASAYDDANYKAISDMNTANALRAQQSQKHEDFMYKLEEDWAPKMKEKEYKALVKTIQKMDAEIKELGSRSDMNVAQKEKLIEEKFETIARKNGIEFDNNLRNECRDYLKSQIKNETLIMENTERDSYWRSRITEKTSKDPFLLLKGYNLGNFAPSFNKIFK